MTVTTTALRTQYDGDDATATFAIGFSFSAAANIKVVHTTAAEVDTTWVQGTQYNVTGTNVVVVTSPTDYTPATGERITILSIEGFEQATDLTNDTGLDANATLEPALDNAIILAKQLLEKINRAALMPENAETSGPLTLPDPSTGSANQALLVNGTTDDYTLGTVSADATITLPGSSTDNALVRWSGSGAATFQNSGVTVDDSNNLVLPTTNVTGLSSLFVDEKAAADADVAGDGQFWVKTAMPNEAWFTNDAGTDRRLDGLESFVLAASDEVSDLATGTAKVSFQFPYAFTATDVKASVTAAGTTGTMTIDVNDNGTSIMTTDKLDIASAATADDGSAALTTTSFAAGRIISVDIDSIHTTPAKGLKVTLIGYQT